MIMIMIMMILIMMTTTTMTMTVTVRKTRKTAFWWYPPPPHDYPYYWVIWDPKSKEDKVKVTKNSQKCLLLFFWTNITRDTPSQVAWQDVQIWNGSDKYCWRYRADTILSTDGQTDKVKAVYPPFNFAEAGGMIISWRWRWRWLRWLHGCPADAMWAV